MALSGARKASKSSKSPWDMGFLEVLDESDRIQGTTGSREKVERIGSPEKIREVDRMIKLAGVFQKKGDLASIIGALLSFLTDYFGSKKEKKENAKARKAAQEDQAKKGTQEGLSTLQEKVEEDKKEKDAEEEKKPELVKNPELGDGREFVLIGDSAANGMHLSFAEGKRPSFIGKDGMTTFQVLARLKAERGRLKGKKKAMIYCAGNNILATKTNTLVDHMVEMAQICDKAGVPEIIVNSQFPPISDYVKNIGKEKFEEVKKRNSAFVKALKKAHKEGRFPSSVRVVDLTAPFSDEKGEMKEEFVDPKATDYLHPWFAYKPALDHMGRTGESRVA